MRGPRGGAGRPIRHRASRSSGGAEVDVVGGGRYGRVDLLCIDGLGYRQLDRRGAELLFLLLTEREEKASVAIASNDSFGGWTKTFADPRLCAAIVDANQHPRHRHVPGGVRTRQQAVSDETSAAMHPAEEPVQPSYVARMGKQRPYCATTEHVCGRRAPLAGRR
ncbi:ATP-binding protein [Kribbella sp. NPDC005582]|uniref:ATP-binding protein n=1 Tax=Kribbella sp. NPDC005582 TaxID=3156893 RepID=UPI0033B3F5C8